MIVFDVYIQCVSILKFKRQSPVAGDLYRPAPLLLWKQQMKAGAGVVHILDFIRRIKPIQHRFQFGSMLGLYVFTGSIVEKIFQTFMDKRFDHGPYCNQWGYDCQEKCNRQKSATGCCVKATRWQAACRKRSCVWTWLPLFSALILDCLNRTTKAYPQEMFFKAAELAVIAEQNATLIE
jgi:hypothetical protein